MNKVPCGQCHFYDIILGSYEKKTKRGWCMKRSKYPYKEGPGQVFPPDVERVDAGQLAQPFIVREAQVIEACPFAMKSDMDAHEAKLGRVVITDNKGKRLLS